MNKEPRTASEFLQRKNQVFNAFINHSISKNDIRKIIKFITKLDNRADYDFIINFIKKRDNYKLLIKSMEKNYNKTIALRRQIEQIKFLKSKLKR
jgi:hypothetical protein